MADTGERPLENPVDMLGGSQTMDQAPPTPTPGADNGDAPTFAALLQRVGQALHTMSAALRRRGLWLVFGALGGLIGGSAVAATSKPPVNPHRYYKATVGLSLTKSATDAGSREPIAWSLQIAQLAATTDSYMERVATQTGTSAGYVKNHITLISDPETAYVEITAIDTSPERTVQVAHHAGLALNDAIDHSVEVRVARQRAVLNDDLRAAQARLAKLKQEVNAAPESERSTYEPRLQDAEAQVQLVRFQQSSIQSSAPEFTMTSTSEPVRINSKSYYMRWILARSDVGAARVKANAQLLAAGERPDSSTKTILKILANETTLRPIQKIPPAQHIALGLLAGLLLGLSGVVLGEAWDVRVHDPNHVVRASGFELLTEIPRLSRRSVLMLLRAGSQAKSERVRQAASRYQEAATILAHQVGLSNPGFIGPDRVSQGEGQLKPGEAPVVLVTSATPSEGKSTSAAALATAFAQLGYRVLAVDGDYHKRSLRRYVRPIPNFIEPDRPTETRIADVWLLDDLSALHDGRSGTATVTALLNRINALRTEFDVIVVDTPPILITSDATDLLHHADAVALVVRIDHTLVPSCERAGTLVRHRDVPVSGVIATDVPLKMIDRNYGSGG